MLVSLIRGLIDPILRLSDRQAPAMVQTRDLLLPGPDSTPVRLYRPTLDADCLLVFFHGGGLVSSSLDTHDGVCRYLAAGAGVAVLSVGYPLAPEACFADQLDCASRALDWAGSTASPDFIPSRLLAGGDSAGALLALEARRRREAGGKTALDALVLLYPLLSLTPLTGDPPLIRIARSWIRRAARAGPEAVSRSPSPTIPVFVATGSRDPVRLDAEHLLAALPPGVRSSVHIEAGAGHGYLSLTAFSSRARAQARRTAEALKTFIA